MSKRLTNNDYQFIDRDIKMIIGAVSSKYDIPITDLENLKDSLNTQCIANIWNMGNPLRCSRKKINKCYCTVHQSQINKFNKLKYDNYDGSCYEPVNKIDDSYTELECDTLIYKENEYMYDSNNKKIYQITDSYNSIVENIEEELESHIISLINDT
jgi:hypothetical protein